MKTASFNDPPDFPGISFFFDYMIFSEHKKYCKKYNLEEYINKHGGDLKWSIGYENLSFSFNIQGKHFLSVLIHFAKFFANPLSEKVAFMSNRKTIKEEFQEALNFAKNRSIAPFVSSIARTDHPINKNTEDYFIKMQENLDYTKLYEELQKFMKCYYSAHRIKLVIQASLSLNTLEKYVTHSARFVNIPSGILPLDDSIKRKYDPFDTAAFRKMYKVNDYLFFRRMVIMWVLPSQNDLYKSKACEYISTIISHEGQGSLISYLRKKMWNVTCSKNAFFCKCKNTSMYSLFIISVQLSREGKCYTKEILDAIYSYINLLKKEGPQKRIYDEINMAVEYSFRYNDDHCPLNNATILCGNMHLYPPRDYITGNVFFEYDSKEINKFLNYLVPETANIMIFDYDYLVLDKIESGRNTSYIDIEIPQKWYKCWKSIEPLSDFHLPLKNEWLPIECTLISMPAKFSKYPIKLYSDSISDIWYCPDLKFCLPKCYMYFHLVSSLGHKSSENAALMSLYCEILKLLVVKDLCSTSNAGYYYNISLSDRGIIIKIFGPIPQLLLSIIVNCIKDYPNLITKKLYELVRYDQLDIYKNIISKPGSLAEDVSLRILRSFHHTHIDKHNALQNISIEEFQDFTKRFINYLYIQWYVQGNITPDDAIRTIQRCVEIIKCKPLHSNLRNLIKVTQMPLGTNYCKVKNVNKIDSTSIVINTYQIDDTSIESLVIMNLIMKIIKKQLLLNLQYDDVSSKYTEYNEIIEFSITVHVHANKYTSKDIDQSIEEFLEWFGEHLDRYSEDELDVIKERMRISNQHADMNLAEEVDRNWKEIITNQYMFDRLERELFALFRIKTDKLREWFAKYILNEIYVRKLNVHVIGTDTKVQSSILEPIIDGNQYMYIQSTHISNVEDCKEKFYIYPTQTKN
ncbi:Nardilysin [Cyphomyrmex costatus]|uniref:Nardilysin n=1 Tax=Cyphomyrmex costatus TaxID=456900 RepID=A0A195CEG2_9HYME|nr:Nardilysin [Cyphomyrmex costatus]